MAVLPFATISIQPCERLDLGLVSSAGADKPQLVCPNSASAPPSAPGPRRRPTLPRLRMCAFEPRPFPPRELSGVPLAYVEEQLRKLASNYWGKTETADCTLVIPIIRMDKPDQGQFATARRAMDTSVRRATEPALPNLPPLVMKLHTDYLSAHSTLLRALFGGTSPIDLINTSQPMPPSATLLPRVLPTSTSTQPHIFLPIPDPASFRFIVHWCYFRDFRYIADYLDRGILSLDGIARNANYLGLSQEFKMEIGLYYQRQEYKDMLISPVSSTGSDADEEWSDESTEDEMDVEMDADKDLPRGRSPLPRDRHAFRYPPGLSPAESPMEPL